MRLLDWGLYLEHLPACISPAVAWANCCRHIYCSSSLEWGFGQLVTDPSVSVQFISLYEKWRQQRKRLQRGSNLFSAQLLWRVQVGCRCTCSLASLSLVPDSMTFVLPSSLICCISLSCLYVITVIILGSITLWKFPCIDWYNCTFWTALMFTTTYITKIPLNWSGTFNV